MYRQVFQTEQLKTLLGRVESLRAKLLEFSYNLEGYSTEEVEKTMQDFKEAACAVAHIEKLAKEADAIVYM